MTEYAIQPADGDSALPLERRQIDEWAHAFGGAASALWDDSARLAARFWGTPEGNERQVAWHHLLMAVGNFKRQTPIHLHDALAQLPEAGPDPPKEVVVPGELRLARDKARTWRALTALPGLGVATASTLLSALWPGEHVVIDRLAWSSAVGLRASEGLSSRGVSPESRKRMPDIKWEDYEAYLSWVRTTAKMTGVAPRDVERTLYQLPRNIPEAKSRSWKAYGDLLRDRCQEGPSGRP